MPASDPESVLTEEDISNVLQWAQLEFQDGYEDSDAYDGLTKEAIMNIERLVRERLAERIEAANRKSMSDYGLSLIEVLAIIRGER